MHKDSDEYLAYLRKTSPWSNAWGDPQSGIDKNNYLTAMAVQVSLPYDWAEFGVQLGGSAKQLLQSLPANSHFYLFDSFEGLPEDWIKGDLDDPEIQAEIRALGLHTHRKGEFMTAPRERPVFTDPRVHLVVGWFTDTLPEWVKSYPHPQLALVHVDSDLYSSAKTIYRHVGHLLKSGTIVLFDEFTKNHDRKAFMEFVVEHNVRFEYLAAIRNALQVAVRII